MPVSRSRGALNTQARRVEHAQDARAWRAAVVAVVTGARRGLTTPCSTPAKVDLVQDVFKPGGGVVVHVGRP